jgi:hypothetical protein
METSDIDNAGDGVRRLHGVLVLTVPCKACSLGGYRGAEPASDSLRLCLLPALQNRRNEFHAEARRTQRNAVMLSSF